MSGFETGDFGEWTGVYSTSGETANVLSTLPRSGAYHALYQTTSGSSTARAYAYTDFSDLPELYVSMDLYIDSSQPLSPYEGPWLIQLYTSSGSFIAAYGYQETDTELQWACRFSDQYSHGSVGPEDDRWYTIEAYYRRGTSGHTVILYVDGVEVSSLAVDTSSDAGEVRIGMPFLNAGYEFRIFVDNVIISTSPQSLLPDQTLDVQVYSDSALTQVLSSVTWGNLVPGSSINKVMYIHNNGENSVSLSLTTQDWIPTGAVNYIQLTWDYDGSPISPGETVQITMTLNVSPSISGINTFNFNIVILGTII
jgi:hypothetical protein